MDTCNHIALLSLGDIQTPDNLVDQLDMMTAAVIDQTQTV